MYLIKVNQLKGVELILKALRNTHCIASHDLADGIEKTLLYVEQDGRMTLVGNPNVEPQLPVRPKLIIL